MRYQEIRFGQSYRVKTVNHRAEVIGPAEKNSYNGRYRFKVRYPDARPGSRLAELTPRIEAADFIRPWLAEDEAAFNNAQRKGAEIKAIEQGLIAAGYKPYAIRYMSEDKLYLAFESPTAQAVVEALLSSANSVIGQTAQLEQVSERFD